MVTDLFGVDWASADETLVGLTKDRVKGFFE